MSENGYGLPRGFTKASKKRRPMMIFRHVRDHLLRQGERSMDPDGIDCEYRTETGLACAVGCLIPDAFGPEHLAGDVDDLFGVLCSVPKAAPWIRALDPYRGLLNRVQALHDSYDPSSWEGRLLSLEQDVRRGYYDGH